MSSPQEILQHYLVMALKGDKVNVDGDTYAEIAEIVDGIIEAAQRPLLTRIEALEKGAAVESAWMTQLDSIHKPRQQPRSVWVVEVEYKKHDSFVIAVAESFDQVLEWMPEIVREGWHKEKGFIGYYACEQDVGVLNQDDYSFCRFDWKGQTKDSWLHRRADR